LMVVTLVTRFDCRVQWTPGSHVHTVS